MFCARLDVARCCELLSLCASLKMAVSVFPGVRLLSIGDANGDIQRHSEQQPLRLEVKLTPDAALLKLSNSKYKAVLLAFVSGPALA